MSKEVHKTSKLLWGSIVAGIGFCASCIAIFAFVTGRQSIPDIINTPIINPVLLNTPIFVERTSTSTNQPSPTAISNTPIPTMAEPTTTPMVIDSSNASVSITLQDLSSGALSGKGRIRMQFQAGNVPLRNVYIYFHYATQDITGKWTLVRGATKEDGYNMAAYKTNENGIIEETLEGGNYAGWNQDYSANWNQLNGTWGVQAFYFNNEDPMQTILFPIQSGKLTDIKISLAHLEIGVITKDGNAAKERLVYLYCQGEDVTGKKIPVDCGDGKNVHKTDYTGLTAFNLGSGVYVVEVYSNGHYYDFYDISVQPGETRREIFTIDN